MTTTNGHKPAPHVRVVRYLVQPVLMVEDGEDLAELLVPHPETGQPMPPPPIPISRADWPNVQEIIQAQVIDAANAALARQHAEALTVGEPRPNRAQRRQAARKPTSKVTPAGS